MQYHQSKNYYEVLGVTTDADPEVIRAAFRALAKKYHPDAAPSKNASTNARFREINEAHSILSNSESRATYDYSLAQTDRPKPSQPSQPPKQNMTDKLRRVSAGGGLILMGITLVFGLVMVAFVKLSRH